MDTRLKFKCMSPMEQAKDVARYSTCQKKHLGCVLILKDGKRVSGWNGPPRQLNPCKTCPRLNDPSSTNLHLCRAMHAERMTLVLCAKYGHSTKDSVLYSYMGVPCKDCLIELIASGVREIVCISETYYDELSRDILAEWIETGGKFRVLKID